MVGMWKTDLEIELNEQERQELERLDRSLTASHRAVIRARTILRLAAGMPVSAVAREVGRGRRIVRKWGVRFHKKRLRGLLDLHRSGRPPRFSPRGRHAPGEAGVRAA
jgi:winged helix-turn helix protein